MRATRLSSTTTALAACLAALLTLSACSSDDQESLESAPGAAASAAPSAAAATTPPSQPTAACPTTARTVPAPAGSTTDLATKPVIKAQTDAAPTEVLVSDVVVGTGAEAKAGDQVEVKYVGVVRDTGTEFDASWNQSADATIPFEVCGEGVIPGFAVAPLGMKVGGRRLVQIPSEFGYGPSGQPAAGIQGDDVLVFAIDLVKVG